MRYFADESPILRQNEALAPMSSIRHCGKWEIWVEFWRSISTWNDEEPYGVTCGSHDIVLAPNCDELL